MRAKDLIPNFELLGLRTRENAGASRMKPPSGGGGVMIHFCQVAPTTRSLMLPPPPPPAQREYIQRFKPKRVDSLLLS